MCGISGIVYPKGLGREIEPSRLDAMRDVISHRGPDAKGSYIDGNIGLAHRRLSIVDVAHGAQPMHSADGQNVIVYNGEVFDHMQSRETLADLGHRFETTSDTETILHLYREFGRNCVDHLRGMFAFAIYDKGSGEVFFARDRFGIKPLYYHLEDDGRLFFASEIKALFESGEIKPELNTRALPDQLANHGTSGEQTLFRGIKRLLPGHTMTWKDGKVAISKYWDLDYEPKADDLTEKQTVEKWLELFRESVKLRLMADVPLGMFLSGGIDSSAIAAVMSEMVTEPIKTFSVGFAEVEANEQNFARIVAEKFKTDHHEITITPQQFFDAIPKMVWHEDEPIGFTASVPLFFLSKLAEQHVKVVLTGEGSDEMLAGYGRYQKALKLLEIGEKYESVTPKFFRRAVKSGVSVMPGYISNKLSRTFLSRPADAESLFFDNFGVFPVKMQRQLFSREMQDQLLDIDPYQYQNGLIESNNAEEMLDKLLYADVKTYLHELLMKQDQMSMAASIESRVPFLDHKLAEFSARLPLKYKLRGNTPKWILREAMNGILPPEILDRPKMGFPVPMARWLRREFKPVVSEYVLSERVFERNIFDRDFVTALIKKHDDGENHEERIWALINFEMWQRIFFDGEGVDHTAKREQQ